MRLRADYVKLCAAHIIAPAGRGAQAVARYVRLCEVMCKLCEIMCNPHNHPYRAVRVSSFSLCEITCGLCEIM